MSVPSGRRDLQWGVKLGNPHGSSANEPHVPCRWIVLWVKDDYYMVQ